MTNVHEATQQPDYTGSCMIALYPPSTLADTLATDDGPDPGSLHLTIAYVGPSGEVDKAALNRVAAALAARSPITALLSGHGRFTGAEDLDCVVALLSSPRLDDLRRDTEDLLAAERLSIRSAYGFCPHIAIEYVSTWAPSPVQRIAALPVEFGAVSAVHGQDRTDYAFTPTLADAAAEAYMTGWALSGGPASETLSHGCHTAVTAALEQAANPRLLEVVLEVGKTDGTWARVLQRRDDLIRHHVAEVEAVWRRACKNLDRGRLVRSFRGLTGMTRESAQSDEARAQAKMLAAGMLGGIRYGDDHEALITAIEEALAAAIAEGKTGVLAAAAAEGAHDGFIWAAAFEHMYEPLTHLENLPGMADPWVEALISGNAADIGQRLASLAANGGTYQEMVDAVEELTTGDSIRAVITLIDYAMSGSANQGALNLYAAEGIEAYDVMTAGDARVCPACDQAQDDNPHTLLPGQIPIVPAHPLCRCCVAASQRALPFSAFSQFLKAAA